MWLLPRGGGGSGGCAHGGNMSSRPSAWPCPQPSTTVSTRWRLARSTTPHGGRAGVRPEPLEEVSEPQVRAATVGYVAAAGAPLLAVPSLAGGDAIDDTSVNFLLEMALLSPEEVEQLRRAERRKLAREREEKEREKKRENERQN